MINACIQNMSKHRLNFKLIIACDIPFKTELQTFSTIPRSPLVKTFLIMLLARFETATEADKIRITRDGLEAMFVSVNNLQMS